MELLSSCTVGRLNITTIEAKVQSLFHFEFAIDSILDLRATSLCKLRMAQFFFNAFIDVEMAVVGLNISPKMWQFLYLLPRILSSGIDSFRSIEKGQCDIVGKKPLLELTIVFIMIVESYFNRYYEPSLLMIQDLSILTPEKGSEAKVFVQNIIASLFFKIKECYEIDSSYLSEYHKGVMYKSLVLLNQSSERSLASDVTKNKTEIIEQLDFVDDNYYESRLSVFLRSLDCEEIENFIMTENEKFIDTLEALPKKGTSSLHFDRVIEKIISHLARRLDQSRSNLSQTAVWVIQSFRVMIERAWGMSIFDRDSEGGEEQDLASKNIVLSLNACGATSLCLDILACGSEVLNLEAIQLCVAMLFKEGGAKEIQETIYDHLSSSRSSDIFLSVQRIILELKDWFKWNMSNDDDSNQLNPPRLLITLRFLQLMCEGHYLNNQDIMRDQGKSVTVNLLADFVEFLALLSKNPNK